MDRRKFYKTCKALCKMKDIKISTRSSYNGSFRIYSGILILIIFFKKHARNTCYIKMTYRTDSSTAPYTYKDCISKVISKRSH